ncbi:MAG: T9SS type A sorting domain-containing protein [Bacteroidetes bacterium]|nr:T9SS type A sorting domain-containing protein [Bacteroidota bacterium]
MIKAISLNGTGTGSFVGISQLSGQGNIGGIGARNIIGDSATTNDISVASSGTCTGIQSAATDTTTISYNAINNIYGSNSSNITTVRGMLLTGAIVYSVTDNTIRNLKTNGTNVSLATAAVHGIYSSTTNTAANISRNAISGLYCLGTTTASYAIGISQAGSGGGLFTKNRISNMENASATGGLIGIYQNAGVIDSRNNQISIKNGSNTNDLTINGILVAGGTSFNSYYNTVYIGGTVASGNINSTAITRTATVTNNFVNNIFYNERTGGSGAHLGASYSSITNGTFNYNLYISSNPGALVRFSSTNYSLAGWKAAQNRDTSSYGDSASTVANTIFTDAANGDLSINTSSPLSWYANGKGIAGAASGSTTDDYNGDTRGTTYGFGTDLGSDEFTTSTIPPAARVTGNIANNDSTSYTFAGRKIATIKWHNSTSFYGTSFPSSITALYYTGETPPDPTNGGNNPAAKYMNGYWVLNQTGGTHYKYDVSLFYDDALIGSVTSEANMKLGKKPAVAGTGDWKAHYGSVVNTTTNMIRFTDLNGFSVFTPTDNVDPLPISLLTFDAVASGVDASLTWQTSTEFGSSHINVLRSLDGNSFERIATLKAKGNSFSLTDYAFVDQNAASLQTSQVIYYQLEMVDANGLTNYSDTRQVNFKKSFTVMSIYPQPIGEDININLSLSETSQIRVSLLDMNGKVILTDSKTYNNGNTLINLNTADLAAGIYLVRIENGDQVSVNKVFKK